VKSAACFRSAGKSGVTIIEVLASALLIFLGLGAIFAMNTQSLQILRSTRMLANGSQVLQERMESMRNHPWPEVANGQALAKIWEIPAPSVPGAPKTDSSFFKIQRRYGKVTIFQNADLTAQPLLLVDMTVSWKEKQETKQRHLRTIIGKTGLTRSGIFGSAFGRPETSHPATLSTP